MNATPGGYGEAAEIDPGLWLQMGRVAGEEPLSLIRAANLDWTRGAEAWRVVKQRYDQYSRTARDVMRADLFRGGSVCYPRGLSQALGSAGDQVAHAGHLARR